MEGRRRAALGLLLFVAALVPLRLWRASLESSLWIDETASLVLANQPVSRIFDLSAIDTNPPGYFLLLKAWLKLGRALGLEPGILWARALGVLAWAGLALVAWAGGRRLLGPTGGTVLTVAVAGSSYAALFAKDARGYGIASVALFACFLLLLASSEDDVGAEGRGPSSRRASAVRWLLYAGCAALALWTHLLSSLVLGCLALLWLVLVARSRAWTSRFARLGAGAHVAAALSFLPWLLEIEGQLAVLQEGAPAWMTPATWFNLSSVFWYWYPFGPVGLPDQPPTPSFPVLGALSALVPLAAALGATLVSRNRGGPSRRFALLAASGLGVSVAFVTLLWLAHRAGLAAVFHAPRYPALAAALWASGLVGLAGVATARRGSRPPGLWALVSAWLACAVLGQLWVHRLEAGGGLRPALQGLVGAPPHGATLYVMPSELIPFWRQSLAGYDVRRIEELPCGLTGVTEGWALSLSTWRLFDRARDLVAQQLLAGDALAATVERLSFPEPGGDYRLYHLRDVRQDAAAALCREGLRPAAPAVPHGAATVALPESQLSTDGWSYLELTGDLVAYRWGTAPEVSVRFDRPLPAGDYRVHYQGYRSAEPEDPVRMELSFGDARHAVVQPAGDISTAFTIHLGETLEDPVLVVRHPTWAPAETSGSSDARRLASAFSSAWIERAR